MGERAGSAGSLVGRAQQHRPPARRAIHDGADGRTRSFEPRIHLRVEDGSGRDAKIPRGGLHARMARGNRDERRRAAAGRREMGAPGTWNVGMTSSPIPDSRFQTPGREGQTFTGASKWITYVNFVKL